MLLCQVLQALHGSCEHFTLDLFKLNTKLVLGFDYLHIQNKYTLVRYYSFLDVLNWDYKHLPFLCQSSTCPFMRV